MKILEKFIGTNNTTKIAILTGFYTGGEVLKGFADILKIGEGTAKGSLAFDRKDLTLLQKMFEFSKGFGVDVLRGIAFLAPIAKYTPIIGKYFEQLVEILNKIDLKKLQKNINSSLGKTAGNEVGAIGDVSRLRQEKIKPGPIKNGIESKPRNSTDIHSLSKKLEISNEVKKYLGFEEIQKLENSITKMGDQVMGVINKIKSKTNDIKIVFEKRINALIKDKDPGELQSIIEFLNKNPKSEYTINGRQVTFGDLKGYLESFVERTLKIQNEIKIIENKIWESIKYIEKNKKSFELIDKNPENIPNLFFVNRLDKIHKYRMGGLKDINTIKSLGKEELELFDFYLFKIKQNQNKLGFSDAKIAGKVNDFIDYFNTFIISHTGKNKNLETLEKIKFYLNN